MRNEASQLKDCVLIAISMSEAPNSNFILAVRLILRVDTACPHENSFSEKRRNKKNGPP